MRGPIALLLAMLVSPTLSADRDAFRVCADPNNLPFSNKQGEGLENRLAEIWAKDLGVPLEYTWFPQRMGFIRNTLRAVDPQTGQHKCDVVMGIVQGYELLMTTKPYYRSTYALVYVKGRSLDAVRTAADLINMDPERRQKLLIGTYAETPGAVWLARHGMTDQMIAYPVMSGDPAVYPGEIIETQLFGGQIDAAIVWGPIAGFFARRADDVDVELILLESEPGIQFDFAISAGVRYGEGEAKREIDALIDRTGEEITALLEAYHVPLRDGPGELSSAARPDSPD